MDSNYFPITKELIMKSIIIILVAVFTCGNIAYAQKNVNIPSKVKSAFSKEYPKASKIKWEKEGDKYESSFLLDGKEMSILYSSDGVVEETEIRIDPSELPAKAKAYVQSKGRIKEAAKISLKNGTVKYEAEVNGKDFLFDDKGNFLEERVEKD